MTAIAKWRVLAVLAVAQPDFLLLGQAEFFGSKACAFVGTITHGLVTTESAGTPPVITGFEFKNDWFLIVDVGERFHRLTDIQLAGRSERIIFGKTPASHETGECGSPACGCAVPR
jgi:hypothetical protein